MFKVILSIILSFLFIGCLAMKEKFYVDEINDDNCIKMYYRIVLKKINNDSIFQVLSEKDEMGQATLKVGDTIYVNIEKMERSELKEEVKMRPDSYYFYCNDKIILKPSDSFYKSKNIKGLRVLN
jgi:hypothetical protein